MSKPLSSYSSSRGYGTFNSVPIFILTDPLFELLVKQKIRDLKHSGVLEVCMIHAREEILPPTLDCPNIKYLFEFAKLIMKLKEMEKDRNTYDLFESLEILKEFLKFEFENIIDKPSLISWCSQNLSERFDSLPKDLDFYDEYIEIMKQLEDETDTVGIALQGEIMKAQQRQAAAAAVTAKNAAAQAKAAAQAEAAAAGETLIIDSRGRRLTSKEDVIRLENQNIPILHDERRQKGLNKSLFESWGEKYGGKGKRTQRGRKQRKLKHKRYSSRYKRKSKSRR